MNNTSANQTGLSALQLAAALTEEQWAELEGFADKRLRRCLKAPSKQRALAIYDGRTLVHTAIEQFALGDLGLLSGRKLPASNRATTAGFVNAMHSAINSIINHALSRAEFSRDHLPVGLEEIEYGVCEPPENTDLSGQLEIRDLEQQLFSQLEQEAGGNPDRLDAVEALKNDCTAGHACGENGLNIERNLKHHTRRQAQDIWRNLTVE